MQFARSSNELRQVECKQNKFILHIGKMVKFLSKKAVEARSINEFKPRLSNLCRVHFSLAFKYSGLSTTASSGCP